MPLSQQLKALITARKRAKNTRERQQPKLIENREVHKASIEAKLSGLMSGNQFENFRKCGREEIYRTCRGCHKFETFYFSCNRRWCPLCNYKLTNKRAATLHVWTKRITQPKHLVLTIANIPVLTRRSIRGFQKALLALRRQKVWSEVRGGCCSIEITNEGRGWHLHAHILIDTDWVEMPDLSRAWAKLVGQQFAIVKIKDVRECDYVKEVSKYVAKGSDLAGWEPERLMEFIHAIKGIRFFCTFGSLTKQADSIRRELALAKHAGRICDCGSDSFCFETEAQSIIRELRRSKRR